MLTINYKDNNKMGDDNNDDDDDESNNNEYPKSCMTMYVKPLI